MVQVLEFQVHKSWKSNCNAVGFAPLNVGLEESFSFQEGRFASALGGFKPPLLGPQKEFLSASATASLRLSGGISAVSLFKSGAGPWVRNRRFLGVNRDGSMGARF